MIYGGAAEAADLLGDLLAPNAEDATLNAETTAAPQQEEPTPRGNPVVLSPPVEGCEADNDEPVISSRRRRRRKRRREVPFSRELDYAAAATEASEGHVDLLNRESLQQLIKEETGKRIVKAQEVRNSTGPVQERWKLAAESELTNNFTGMGAFHESTPEELAAHGRPLPMLCVWSQAEDYYKCRACVCVATLRSWIQHSNHGLRKQNHLHCCQPSNLDEIGVGRCQSMMSRGHSSTPRFRMGRL